MEDHPKILATKVATTYLLVIIIPQQLLAMEKDGKNIFLKKSTLALKQLVGKYDCDGFIGMEGSLM